MILISLGLVCLFALPGVSASEVDSKIWYGAAVNPTGNPIGGGEGYSDIFLSGDFIVHNKEELLQALSTAKMGTVVYIHPSAEIDLTGTSNIAIPGGITLAGNRGHNGSPGPLLFTDDIDAKPLLNVVGPNTRITGIRLQGPDGEVGESRDALPTSAGIQTDFDHLEVDNNEIYNWSFAGVNINRGQDAYIHHNYIHHCQRTGLGYPVVVYYGTMLVEANLFDFYRHSIAGAGYRGSGYEARYNISLENSIGHAFDMHGGSDFCPRRAGGSNPCTEDELWMAGDWVKIHHNTFFDTRYRSIVIRGVPQEMVEVHSNWFVHSDPSQAFIQDNYRGNAWVHDNVYGHKNMVLETYIDLSPLVYKCSTRHCYLSDSGQLVGIAGEAGAKLGFSAPLDQDKSTIRGSLTVNVEVDLAGAITVEEVQILLDGHRIFTDSQPPSWDTLVVDTQTLKDGAHELLLNVRDGSKGSLSKSVVFVVDNWWTMEVEMKPPLDSGWFGQVDLSMASAKSSGWTYDTSNPQEFGGDADRAVNPGSSEEFFVWDTPLLSTFAITAFAPTPSVSGVLLEGSADQKSWSPLRFDNEATKLPGSTWYETQLTGEIDGEINYFRLTVQAEQQADTLQIGKVEFVGVERD